MANLKGVTPGAMPWARSVESRLGDMGRVLTSLGYGLSSLPNADKTVSAEYSTGQNIPLGTSGRVEPTTPVAVRYASSTGLYEVTVSVAGLVRDGATVGAGFESDFHPYEIYFDIPRDGVVCRAAPGDTAWTPFSASYSTIVSTRPGVQNLNLYLYGVCTSGTNSAGYVKRIRLTAKAV